MRPMNMEHRAPVSKWIAAAIEAANFFSFFLSIEDLMLEGCSVFLSCAGYLLMKYNIIHNKQTKMNPAHPTRLFFG
jgi:hypothetical protein